ncbi:hypothetical protein PGTUg99_037508 [Puccinia graminis f. sp. tritici]|uniref:Uncharacterized protein n=1 Tax=Puccinia graminis f. sp. tritici TaxID=56615 RepID=A0A5B0SMZ3_PUCGR|nr:hypothetical protein PGTUg99_037508 [Puccinia graminis f. sp. tritici]
MIAWTDGSDRSSSLPDPAILGHGRRDRTDYIVRLSLHVTRPFPRTARSGKPEVSSNLSVRTICTPPEHLDAKPSRVLTGKPTSPDPAKPSCLPTSVRQLCGQGGGVVREPTHVCRAGTIDNQDGDAYQSQRSS